MRKRRHRKTEKFALPGRSEVLTPEILRHYTVLPLGIKKQRDES